jgi:hypothetical protein
MIAGVKRHSHHAMGVLSPPDLTRGILMRDNVGPITGRAGAEPRSSDRNHTAGPVRCIGGLCSRRAVIVPVDNVKAAMLVTAPVFDVPFDDPREGTNDQRREHDTRDVARNEFPPRPGG